MTTNARSHAWLFHPIIIYIISVYFAFIKFACIILIVCLSVPLYSVRQCTAEAMPMDAAVDMLNKLSDLRCLQCIDLRWHHWGTFEFYSELTCSITVHVHLTDSLQLQTPPQDCSNTVARRERWMRNWQVYAYDDNWIQHNFGLIEWHWSTGES
jgi:hypothetical protein